MALRSSYTLNEYRFQDTKALRAVLRNLKYLPASDIDSATLIFDLQDALDNPDVLTPTEKEAIQLNLIDGCSAQETASRLGVGRRAVFATVSVGLRRLLAYLQTGHVPPPNQYEAWTQAEIAALKSMLDLPRSTIAGRMRRTTSAVYQQISKLKRDGLLAANRRPGRPLSADYSRSREVSGVPHSHGVAT